MKPMGALQLGLPSPVALPKDWNLLIVDLKDCFFSIPLHPSDTERFAFSVPQKNTCWPTPRYEWAVLPQGMRNSPTICQWYVDLALTKWKLKYPDVIVYHYMDDILLAREQETVKAMEQYLLDCLAEYGLQVAPEKVQRNSPWLYLGMVVTETQIRPGKLKLHAEVKTVNDLQKLIGDIQWIHTWCGITNEDMGPLFALLQGSTEPTEPRKLTDEAKRALLITEQKIDSQQVYRYDPDQPIIIAIYGAEQNRSAIIMQCISGKLTILEWVFPTHIPGATITSLPDYIGNLLLKARERVRLVFGLEPAQFILPWKMTDLVHEWSENSMTFAIASHGVEQSVHYPAHPIFKTTSIITRGPIVSQQPISGAKTLFTDASGRTGKYGFAWKTGGEWMIKIWEEKGSSVQVLELKALVASLNHHVSEFINVVSDSQYAVSLLNRMENAKIGKITTPQIAELTLQFFGLLASRTHLIWCTHMKSHTNIPGIFVEGNSVIDKAVSGALSLQGFDAARKAHDFFHQSA